MPPRKKKVPQTFDEHLANVIESKRKKKNLTVEELAEAAGIGYQTMRRRLDGSPFTVNEVERVGLIVDVPTAKLVQEALDDYGAGEDGLQKLISEYRPKDDPGAGTVHAPEPPVSGPTGTVTTEDDIPYIGRIVPPESAAADENPRTPGKD